MAFVRDMRKAYYQNEAEITSDLLQRAFGAGEIALQFVVDISLPHGGSLHFSDAHLYVGTTFYEGRLDIPRIERKITELLAPQLSFSELELSVSNVDGKFNHLLPGGSQYTSFIGQTVELKVGLAGKPLSFKTLFRGRIPSEGGVERGANDFTLRARDELEQWNRPIPLPQISETAFLDAPDDSLGKYLPLVLGDWSFGWSFASVAPTKVGEVDVATMAAADNMGGTVGYFVGYDGGLGGYFAFAVGTYAPDNIEAVLIKRGDAYLETNFNAIAAALAGISYAAHITSLKTSAGGSAQYTYQSGDVAVIRVKVPYEIGGYSNLVTQARHVLKVLSNLTDSDFDENTWTPLETKASPSQSAITTLKSRLWVGDDKQKSLETALNLLKQVRIDLYVTQERKVALRSLHPEDWPQPNAIERIKNSHIVEKSVKPQSDKRNFFTSAAANYAFSPITGKTTRQSSKRSNANAISKAGGEVAKAIDLPALYIEADAVAQIDEYVKLFSSGLEYIQAKIAWPHLLRELGEFVSVNIDVGSIKFSDVPMMIRTLAIDAKTASIDVQLLSFANFPYPQWQPSFQDRMLSSYNQSIS